MCKIICPNPNCQEVGDWFIWQADLAGHPTIESMQCGECGASSTYFDEEEIAEKLYFDYDEWLEADENQNKD